MFWEVITLLGQVIYIYIYNIYVYYTYGDIPTCTQIFSIHIPSNYNIYSPFGIYTYIPILINMYMYK